MLFGRYIGYIVSQTMRTNFDLVNPAYYQQELAYQQRIDSVARAAARPVAVAITHDAAASQLRVQLPPSFAGKRLAGQLHFFRSCNLHLDFTLPLHPSPDLTQRTQKMLRLRSGRPYLPYTSAVLYEQLPHRYPSFLSRVAGAC